MSWLCLECLQLNASTICIANSRPSEMENIGSPYASHLDDCTDVLRCSQMYMWMHNILKEVMHQTHPE